MTTNFVIPVYNAEKYLDKTLQSIYNQTDEDYVVTCVDDKSTDNSLKILMQWQGVFNKKGIDFEILENSDNLGATKSRMLGINQFETEYYVPLDADDIIESNYLEAMIPEIESSYKIGFVYCDARYFGDVEHTFHLPEYNFRSLCDQNYITYCSLFRRAAYYASGGYNHFNRGYYEDWELYIRMGQRGIYGLHAPEVLFNYRVHPESISHSEFMKKSDSAFRAYFIKKYPELYPREWQVVVDEALKDYPEDFMSMPKEAFE